MAARVNSHWLPLNGLIADPRGGFVGKDNEKLVRVGAPDVRSNVAYTVLHRHICNVYKLLFVM